MWMALLWLRLWLWRSPLLLQSMAAVLIPLLVIRSQH